MAVTEPKTTDTLVENKSVQEPEVHRESSCRVYDREGGRQDYVFAQGRISCRDSLRDSSQGVL
jgi:hypothetical protein